tara:strand:+ start:424 stop:2955 length:2532 start_codon:yes stop_codon:yes gene_type:complete
MRNILIASNLGIYGHGMAFDSHLYDVIERNDMNPSIAICDGIMDACQMSKFSRVMPEQLSLIGQDNLCKKCFDTGKIKVCSKKNIIYLSKYLKKDEKIEAEDMAKSLTSDEIIPFTIDDFNIGEHAHAAAIRYFASTKYLNETHGPAVLKKFFIGALKVYFSYREIFSKHIFDTVIVHHGIYSPQGIVVGLAKKNNIKVVTWIKSYRKDTYLFSWGDSYHYTMQSISDDWKKFDFDKELQEDANKYLLSRRYGTYDSIHFNNTPEPPNHNLKRNKTFLLLTSVFWDAVLHYKTNLFKDQVDWLIQTIRYFKENPDIGNLIIRIHPAEVTGIVQSRDKALDRINDEFSQLPNNIIIYDSTSKVSTYDLIDESNAVIVYNTKASIEASAMRKPVIVAGDAWIKSLSFSLNPESIEDYFKLLHNFNVRLNDEMHLDALKFFYYFYFRRMFTYDCFTDKTTKIRKKSIYEFNQNLYNDISKIQKKSEKIFLDSLKNNKPFVTNKEKIHINNNPLNQEKLSFIKKIGIRIKKTYIKEIRPLIIKIIYKIKFLVKLSKKYTKYFLSLKWLQLIPAKINKTIRLVNNIIYRIKRKRSMSFSQIESQMNISRGSSTLKSLKMLKEYSGNMVLQTTSEKEIAYDVCDFINLKQHHDTFKSWDKLGFLSTITQNTDNNSVILDAGSGTKAVIASALVRLGFKNVHACDLQPELMGLSNKDKRAIDYKVADLRKLPYDDCYFDFIASMSVIEHVGDIEPVVSELARIIKPNGCVQISTDYWETKIDCKGIFPYGQTQPEMKIFSKDEILQLIEIFEQHGLQLTGNLSLACNEKVCKWERVNREYTFCRLLFVKK